MKGFRLFLTAALLMLLSHLSGQPVFGQGIPHVAETIDIPIDNAGGSVTPLDLNDHDTLLAQGILPQARGTAFIAKLAGDKDQDDVTVSKFACADLDFTATFGTSINDSGDIVGYCSLGPLGTDPNHGFIRDRMGHVTYLDYPGATLTLPMGISNNRVIVGVYYGPQDLSRSGLFRIHGFKWQRGVFSTIDRLDLPNTYTMLRSVDREGQIIGEFVHFDPATNATLEEGWFLYARGMFSFPFPDSFEWEGGPSITLTGINDFGQVIGMRSNNTDSSLNGPFLWEQGHFFRIELPPDFEFPQVSGINTRGEIVGNYQRKDHFDPTYQVWVYKTHGFIAIPAPRWWFSN